MTSELNETKAVITLNQDNVPIFHGWGLWSGEQSEKTIAFRIKVDRY